MSLPPPPPPRWTPPTDDDAPEPLPSPGADDPADLERPDSRELGSALRTAAGPGRFDPVPVVVIGGADIASSVSGTAPVALDDFAVRWGRDGAFDQPTPATASVALWDPTGVWAIGRDLIGATLDLAWTATKPGVGPVRQVFFRGRITAVKPQRRSVLNTDGALVQLTASSLLTDLANRVPSESWPQETLTARAAKILPYLPATVSAIALHSVYAGGEVAPVAGADQGPLLDSLTALYESAVATRMTYVPDTRLVRNVNRRIWSTPSPAQLWWNKAGDGTARDDKGVYARTRPLSDTSGGAEWLPQYLDAAEVEDSEEILSRDITARVTRVELSHPDALGSPAYTTRTETRMVDGTTEGTQGVRAIRLNSDIVYNSWAQQAAADFADMAAREAAGWAIQTLTWRVDRAGGFEFWDQFADVALSGTEVPSAVFLQRSWLPQWGIRPIYAVIGGTIAYRRGWQIDMQFLPLATGFNNQHAITWEEFDDGSSTYEVQWHDGEHTRGMHESLTYEDLGFVGRGVGMTTTPANTGWDEVLF